MNQVLAGEKNELISVTQGDSKPYDRQTIATILSHGDCIGSVMILSKEMTKNSNEVLLQVAKTGASFLGKHMEQ